jgi:hypothetical protein
MNIEDHYNEGGDCWGWLQCKSHIADEGKNVKKIILEKPHIVLRSEEWRSSILYIETSSSLFQHTFILYSCLWVFWDVVQTFTLKNMGVLESWGGWV